MEATKKMVSAFFDMAAAAALVGLVLWETVKACKMNARGEVPDRKRLSLVTLDLEKYFHHERSSFAIEGTDLHRNQSISSDIAHRQADCRDREQLRTEDSSLRNELRQLQMLVENRRRHVRFHDHFLGLRLPLIFRLPPPPAPVVSRPLLVSPYLLKDSEADFLAKVETSVRYAGSSARLTHLVG